MNKDIQIHIRPAQPSDAVPAAILIRSALEPLTSSWTGSADESESMRGLEEIFRQEGNRMSHQYTLVAEASGEGAVGLIQSFGGREEARLNQLLEALLREVGREAQIAREAADD